MSRNKEERAAAKKLLKKPRGSWGSVDLNAHNSPEWMTRAFKNNRYVVMIDEATAMTGGFTAIRAMVQRHDDKPIRNHWAEMQRIKNELFGEDATAIEYYPACSDLVDVANVYWLWILPDDKLPKWVPVHE